jgi:hypothetical protein
MLVIILSLGYCLKLIVLGHERPIAFFSRKLNSTQRAWSTIEKEAYAVLEALRRFESFVFSHEVFVYSDHNPLSYLTVSAPNSAKLLRWSLALQNFNLKFRYKAGKSAAMSVPDCLTIGWGRVTTLTLGRRMRYAYLVSLDAVLSVFLLCNVMFRISLCVMFRLAENPWCDFSSIVWYVSRAPASSVKERMECRESIVDFVTSSANKHS